MGDRANIYLFEDRFATTEGSLPPRTGIYLYTHWAGYRWPEALRAALEHGQNRWGDESYLARIIASQVFKDLGDDLTGGGISTRICDNEYPILCVNLLTNEVGMAGEDVDHHDPRNWENVVPFAKFVAVDKADWDTLGKLV